MKQKVVEEAECSPPGLWTEMGQTQLDPAQSQGAQSSGGKEGTVGETPNLGCTAADVYEILLTQL